MVRPVPSTSTFDLPGGEPGHRRDPGLHAVYCPTVAGGHAPGQQDTGHAKNEKEHWIL